MPDALIEAAFGSRAQLAVVPMQDLMGLGSEARMNTPGTTEGNWRWRFEWAGVSAGLAGRCRQRTQRHARAIY
jgi:4-alpha-glucanotransferase